MNDTTGTIDNSADIATDAIIHPSATIGEGVVVEAGAIVGPHCSIGRGTRLRARCIVSQHTTLGEENDVHPFAVLGGDPQDLAYNPETPGRLVVGSRNLFREGVTISRSTEPGPDTVIGDENMLMAQSHIGHNSRIGNNNILGNGASLSGHVHMGNRNVLSGFSMVHQFTDVGDLTMFQGGAGVGMHVPPFMIVTQVARNTIAGLNVVGLRRAPGFDADCRREVKELYRRLFRERGAKPLGPMLEELSETDLTPAGRRLVDFCVQALNPENPRRARGLCSARSGSKFGTD